MKELKMNGFTEMSEIEMYDVNGGWSWKSVLIGAGIGLVAGAIVVTAMFSPGMAVAGIIAATVTGASAGAIVDAVTDLI